MRARYLALELRPPELDDMGFENALATYLREWGERFRIAVDLMVAGTMSRPLPPDDCSALYRIAQEALTNVAKHAHGTSVSVIVEQVDHHLQLSAVDVYVRVGIGPQCRSTRCPRWCGPYIRR